MGAWSRPSAQRLAVAATAVLLLGLVPLRLYLVPPVLFFEGDDAALCTGIARLSNETDIGPYRFHPRRVSIADPGGEIAEFHAQRGPLVSGFYRYDSMPGMYFVGYVTRHLASPPTVLSWLCFVAGTFAPLFFALFLVRVFQPALPAALPLCYAAIATSPEQWVSGSAYINDKIVASCFLAMALYLVMVATDRRRGPQPHGATVSLMLAAGSLLGLATLMRFDTIFLGPLVLLPLWIATGSFRLAVGRWALMLVPAALVYAVVCAYMHASLPLAAVRSLGGKMSILDTHGLAGVLLSAFGPFRLLFLVASMTAMLGAAQHLRRKGGDDPRLRSMQALWTKVAVVLAFIVPELLMLCTLPFKSQKYALFGSSLVAGLCVLIPVALSDVFAPIAALPRVSAGRRRATALVVLVAALIAVDGGIKLRAVGSVDGADGARFLGGHFRLRPKEHRDSAEVSSLFRLLDGAKGDFTGEIVVLRPRWVFEEAMAYQAVSRGWKNTLRLGWIAVDDPSAYVTLNHYAPFGESRIGVMVPSDAEILPPAGFEQMRRIVETDGVPGYLLKAGRPLKPLPPRRQRPQQ